MMSFLVK